MRGVRRIVLAVLAAASVVALGVVAGARLRPSRSAVLRIALPGPLEPRSLYEGDGWLALLEPLAFPGALRVEADGSSVPGLAERVAWRPDGLGVTLHLRASKLRDGTPVRAADVLAAVRRYGRGARLGAALAAIASMRALDDRTIEIALSRPSRDLPELLEAPVYRARDGFPVGAGEYDVLEANAARAVLERSGRRGGYERIVVTAFDHADELWKRLLAREVDLVTALSPSGYATLARYPWIKRYRGLGNRAWILRWTPGSRQRAEVREALALAVDRDHLSRVVGEGFAAIGSRKPGVGYPPPDPERARALLGYRPGQPPVARLIIDHAGSYDAGRQACAVLESDLARVGIAAELRPVTARHLGNAFEDEDLQLTMDTMLLDTDEAPRFEQEIALSRLVLLGASSEEVCGPERGSFDPVQHADTLFPCDQRP